MTNLQLFGVNNENNNSLMHLPSPRYKTVRNGIVVPCKMKDNISGGVYDENMCFIQESVYQGGWLKRGGFYEFDKDTILYEHEDEKVIFLGFFVRHWGHYLVDCLGKFWILLHDDFQKYKICFLDNGIEHIDGNYLELIKMMEIDDDRIITINVPCKFKTVIIPEEGKNDFGYSNEYKAVFRHCIRKVNSMGNFQVPTKIYFSRTLFGDAMRKEIGENEIENLFRRMDYEIMYPEKMSLLDQILCFQNAEEIVCLNGSIPLNSVFASKKLRLVVLNKTSLNHGNLAYVTEMMGIRPIYIDVYYEPIKGHPKYLGEGPFWIEVNNNLVQYIKETTNVKINISKRGIRLYYQYYTIYLKNKIINFCRYIYKKLK